LWFKGEKDMQDPFYVTTPIYYVNDEPHLGHAYTTIVADVLARFARLSGVETFFLTGTDEHGQKVQEAAQRRGITPQEQADEMVVRFKEAWKRLHIAYDDFIRTTEPRHVQVVQTILQKLWDKGDIYKGEYEGWYCVPDERFWTEKDLVDGRCPDCGRPVELLVEPNYFFRMSAYQGWLVAYIIDHPSFIRPDTRRNEVLGYLRQPLGDLCITRPASRLSWGIPLPFAPGYVTYVWFDALINYVTAAGYLEDGNEAGGSERFARLWPAVMHLIGKDILTTHSVYWSTMLQAAGLPQPRLIFAHGWWMVDGAKMSKSVGNVVRPLDMADIYGVDAFRYFLVRDTILGRDADFNQERIDNRYQGDLANDLGNLLHRLTNMFGRYCDGRIPQAGELDAEGAALRGRALALVPQVLQQVEDLALNEALAQVFEVVGEINRYLEGEAPWKLAGTEDSGRVPTILYTAAEALRLVSILLQPVLPERMAELWRRLGWQPPAALREGLSWGQLRPGTPVVAGEPLFPRDVAQVLE
jgi:methionyl-tRNA synthetase